MKYNYLLVLVAVVETPAMLYDALGHRSTRRLYVFI